MNELCDICKQREGHKYLEKDYIEMFAKSKKRIWIWVCRKCPYDVSAVHKYIDKQVNA